MGGPAAKNAKLIIHDLLFHYFGTFSAIGEREATICLELSRAL